MAGFLALNSIDWVDLLSRFCALILVNVDSNFVLLDSSQFLGMILRFGYECVLYIFYCRIKMSKGEQIVLFLPRALKLCWAVGSSPHLQTRDSSLCHSQEPDAWIELTRAASLK